MSHQLTRKGNARILWAVMTRGEAFDANHLSVKPTGAGATLGGAR